MIPAVAAEPASYADRLAALAAKCDELGLAEQAAITRDWVVPRHPGRQYLFFPTEAVPPGSRDQQTTVRQWHDRFLTLRRERAAALFAEAKAASEGGQPARAYQLLFEVLREDPDHAESRRILGYVKTAGRWTLPDAERMAARQPAVDHPQLGWRARSYWRLATPHFEIVTNHSAREALEVGQQLENLHALWRQIFFRYWSTPEALAARFAGRNEPLARPRPKMQVVLFRNQQEYAARLARTRPEAAATLGIYEQKHRTAYFFAGDASVYPTWYHEATHELFQESVPNTSDEPAEEHNFWAVEGAALYMESLAQHNGYWTVGGCESDRLQSARYRGLSGEFLLPLERLTAMGRQEVQSHEQIQMLYGQIAGVAHFLIDGEGGRHREAFIDLLTALYQGAAPRDMLTKLTGQPAALDQQYRAFLNVTDDDLAGIPSPQRLRKLFLGRTAVTDKGLAHLAGCKKLEWLDLSLTATGDAGLANFAAADGLTQLFLEGTRVTDASLPLIGRFPRLELLVLAGVPISDAGAAPLGNLRNLQMLYLTGTPLTDAALEHFRNLKKLETLDIRGTQITPAAIQRMRSSWPKLKEVVQ